jgi:hypothetical protein
MSDDDHEWTEEELETIAAIEEMTREKYACVIEDHDHDEDEFLVVWTDKNEREWGAWFSRRLVNELFTERVLN